MSTETSSPDQIGRYQIVRALGTGAMGTVYLARDESLDRLVALKTFHPQRGADPQDQTLQRKRLLREAKAAGTLSHPNVVTIYDVLERDETVYIAMEYVEGVSLEERLRGSDPLPWGETVDILTQIASALDHLHERGIVHRDIKPANILITDNGRVKITDFGVARPDDPTQTRETSVFGTPQYMAPEQIRGEDPDPRTDVFALGILAYEMLTGRRPFSGGTIAEVTHAILYEPPPPPREQHPSVTDSLAGVLERALRKEPTARFSSAGELVRALRRVTGVVPTGEGPPPSREELDTAETSALEPHRSEGRESRRPRIWLALAAVLVALALAGVTILYLDGSPDEAVRQAREESYFQLITEGRRLMAEGDPEAAIVLFEAASGILPERSRELRLLREAAVRQAEESGIEIRIDRAREALAAGRYDEVVASARGLLETKRGHDRALEILDDVETALAAKPESERVSDDTGSTPTSGGGKGRSEVAEAVTGESDVGEETSRVDEATGRTVERVPPDRTRLRVHLDSKAPAGVLTLYADAEQVLLEPFSFYEKVGWFRREARPGELSRDILVDPSTETLLFLVAREGEPAKALRMKPALPRGETIRVEITLPARGEPRARVAENGASRGD